MGRLKSGNAYTMGIAKLAAPFPWFGGKGLIAHEVWKYLGNVKNYIEPFFGSGAVLLQRPHPPNIETVNDLDGFVCNFWRAVKAAPEEVARWADWPVNECDLVARNNWLAGRRVPLAEQLMADPEWFDPKIAGWWVWGASIWLGKGWGKNGARRKLPLCGNWGQGIHKKISVSLGEHGRSEFILDWFSRLSGRLRHVRVACGDWERVVTPAVLFAGNGSVGVFLDPPYSPDMRAMVYAVEADKDLAARVRAWCLEAGGDARVRIVLAGYEGEHNDLETHGWGKVAGKAHGGMTYLRKDRGMQNATLERLWLSPACLGQTLL